MENKRLSDSYKDKNWKQWGPYLSERQWGTVGEDYSPAGNTWNYINQDLARSYAFRWGEEGIGGFCDSEVKKGNLRPIVIFRRLPESAI